MRGWVAEEARMVQSRRFPTQGPIRVQDKRTRAKSKSASSSKVAGKKRSREAEGEPKTIEEYQKLLKKKDAEMKKKDEEHEKEMKKKDKEHEKEIKKKDKAHEKEIKKKDKAIKVSRTKSPRTSHSSAAREIKKEAYARTDGVSIGRFLRGLPVLEEADVAAAWKTIESLDPPAVRAGRTEVDRVHPFLDKVYKAAAAGRAWTLEREVRVPCVVLEKDEDEDVEEDEEDEEDEVEEDEEEEETAETEPDNKVDHAFFFAGDELLASASDLTPSAKRARLDVMALCGEAKSEKVGITTAMHQAMTYTDRRWKQTVRTTLFEVADGVRGSADFALRKYGWGTNVKSIQFVRQEALAVGSPEYKLTTSEVLPFIPRQKKNRAKPTEGWIALMRLLAATPRELGVLRPPLPPGTVLELMGAPAVTVTRRAALGGWSDVYKGLWEEEDVAVKVATHSTHSNLVREVNVLRSLRTETRPPEVPELVGADVSRKHLVLRPLGTSIWAAKPAGLPEVDAWVKLVGRGALRALKYAHGKSIAHLDVRPDNLIWVKEPAADGGGHAVLIDWGNGHKMGKVLAGLAGVAAYAHDVVLTSAFLEDSDWEGTPMHREGLEYTASAHLDLASLAYTLEALRTGATHTPPWKGKDATDTAEAFVKRRTEWFNGRGTPTPTKALIKQLLAVAVDMTKSVQASTYALFD
jgi:hypothetical protein